MTFHHQLKRSDLLESTLYDSEGFIRRSAVTRVSSKVPLSHTMDMAERFLQAVARD